MSFQLKFWQKILLTLFCFGIAIIGFILKLPAAFRGYDKELHAAFYFLAAAFLNILFAKRNVLIHALIFGGLFLFGMAIEHGQVLSKKLWHIPHGRYDPEDVQGNLKGLIIFSVVWFAFFIIHFIKKSLMPSKPADSNIVSTENITFDTSFDYKKMMVDNLKYGDSYAAINLEDINDIYVSGETRRMTLAEKYARLQVLNGFIHTKKGLSLKIQNGTIESIKLQQEYAGTVNLKNRPDIEKVFGKADAEFADGIMWVNEFSVEATVLVYRKFNLHFHLDPETEELKGVSFGNVDENYYN